jgi:DNA-binding NtrC family response regulator
MRAVENWEVESLGRTVRIDVRYFATATPKLHAEARTSGFRFDLFCKLTGFTIIVPKSTMSSLA